MQNSPTPSRGKIKCSSAFPSLPPPPRFFSCHGQPHHTPRHFFFFKENGSFETEVTPVVIRDKVHLRVLSALHGCPGLRFLISMRRPGKLDATRQSPSDELPGAEPARAAAREGGRVGWAPPSPLPHPSPPLITLTPPYFPSPGLAKEDSPWCLCLLASSSS